MKVVMTGGGTAGHVNPALGIASIIKRNIPGAEIEFIGTKDRLEATLVPKAGYPIHFIEVYGLRRSLSPKNIKTAWKTLTSVIASKKLLKKIKPDLVIGTGGYVCFPVCYAASKLGIPMALHEANAEPGFAVKMLKNRADIVFVNFAEAGKFLNGAKCKVIHSGMPIDHGFTSIDRNDARQSVKLTDCEKYSILSFGGSLGAAHINNAVLDFMQNYLTKHPKIGFTHAAGGRGYPEMKKRFEELGLDKYPNISLKEYIYDMPTRMVAADLVICRSGAATLSELCAVGAPSVLVPSPNVTNDQQYKNAKVLEDRGAALVIRDAELDGERLTSAVDSLLSDAEKLDRMRASALEMAVRDTDKTIYDGLCSILKKNNGRKK